MFTGLVETFAVVADTLPEAPGRRLLIRAPKIAAAVKLGDSIAVNGCCLTVVEIDRDTLAFQAGPETLSRTNLGQLQPGSAVNLERSLRVGDTLGGHFVSGHIDAVGRLLERRDQQDWADLWFSAPPELTKYLVAKGSICVDGVSLTVCGVQTDRFSVQLIPHTLAVTTLGRLKPNEPVNLEVDLLAKYVEKLLTAR